MFKTEEILILATTSEINVLAEANKFFQVREGRRPKILAILIIRVFEFSGKSLRRGSPVFPHSFSGNRS
jgi:hypothetical protein